MDELVEGASGTLYPTGDELFPVVRMPPRKSTPVVLVTPERLAELEAENERLRVALEDVEWVDGPELARGMGGMMEQVCPWCDATYPDHDPECVRQAALEPAP